jgi:hypothetical protein
MESKKIYLIVVEIDRTGFITEFRTSFEEAESLSEELFNYVNMFEFKDREKIIPILKQRDYRTYQIKGNQIYFPCAKSSITDGFCTINVLEIDLNTFCLEKLIKERENHSMVFEIETFTEEFMEKFPKLDLIAN